MRVLKVATLSSWHPSYFIVTSQARKEGLLCICNKKQYVARVQKSGRSTKRVKLSALMHSARNTCLHHFSVVLTKSINFDNLDNFDIADNLSAMKTIIHENYLT